MMPSALTTTTTTTSRVSNHPKLQGQVFDAGEMTYECDGNLGVGGPEPVDCEKLGWSGLSSDPDAEVELQKGVPRFWSEGASPSVLLFVKVITLSNRMGRRKQYATPGGTMH